MYKHKYYKYKLKYQNLLKGGDISEDTPDPDDDGPDDALIDSDVVQVRDTDSDSPVSDEDINDIKITGESNKGQLGDVDGELREMSDFKKGDFIRPQKRNNINKILAIETQDDFDYFTEKYAYLNGKNLSIKWDLIYDLYKGFYLSPSSLLDRIDYVPYLGTTYPSWIVNYRYFDYPTLHITSRSKRVDSDRQPMVFIFDKDKKGDNVMGRSIKVPFEGQVVDPYSLPESKFTNKIGKTVREQRNISVSDMVLLIDNVKTFDIFTNRYGVVNVVNGHPNVVIDWDLVSRDYVGFYIDKDNTFRDVRYNYVFYDGIKYPSWWKMYSISDQMVYLF